MNVTPEGLHLTLAGLEAGLRVSHIATFGLRSCSVSAHTEAVLNDPELLDYSQIAVEDAGCIVGVLERESATRALSVREAMRPLSSALVVSADESLPRFLPLVKDLRYRLVVRGTSICGIVTRSDLLKLPVRILAFGFVTYLELTMARVIQVTFSEPSQWLRLLAPNRRANVEWKRRRLANDDADPDLVELTDFCDKRDIVAKALKPRKSFVDDLKKLEKLRNAVAHGTARYARSDAQLSELVEQLALAQAWIAELGKTFPAGPPRRGA